MCVNVTCNTVTRPDYMHIKTDNMYVYRSIYVCTVTVDQLLKTSQRQSCGDHCHQSPQIDWQCPPQKFCLSSPCGCEGPSLHLDDSSLSHC